MTTALALMLVFCIFAPAALQANEINVTIDGVAVGFEGQGPALIDGRTLVPVRGVFEALGFDVDWDQDVQMATLMRDDFVIRIIIGEQTFGIDDHVLEASGNVELDVPAQIIGGRTLLPIRAVLESVGYDVDWDGSTQTVLVTSPPSDEPEPEPEPEEPGLEYIFIRGERFSTSLSVLHLEGMVLTPTDLYPLRHMENLLTLIVMNNQIINLAAFTEIPSLQSLYLTNNGITDITPLSELTHLRHLGLEGNQITDIRPLSGLTNLEHLFLFNNQISDLSPIASLTNLTRLHISQNEITDLTPLSSLTNLTELRIGNDGISDLTPLASLTNLTDLWVLDSEISDITPLAGLVNLNELSMWDNEIVDLTPLENLTSLTDLNLGMNQITDIAPLAGLVNLTELSLSINWRITDWSHVEHVEQVWGRP